VVAHSLLFYKKEGKVITVFQSLVNIVCIASCCNAVVFTKKVTIHSLANRVITFSFLCESPDEGLLHNRLV
jgi:hypothetical protein